MVIQQVRVHLAAAKAAGGPAPGRPTPVRLTGATDHQVRRAMAILAQDGGTFAASSIPPERSLAPMAEPAAGTETTTAVPVAPVPPTQPTATITSPQRPLTPSN